MFPDQETILQPSKWDNVPTNWATPARVYLVIFKFYTELCRQRIVLASENCWFLFKEVVHLAGHMQPPLFPLHLEAAKIAS